MDTGKAIFFGLALIALAIFGANALRPANAGIMVARYIGFANSQASKAWVLDTETGAVRACSYGGDGSCGDWLGVK